MNKPSTVAPVLLALALVACGKAEKKPVGGNEIDPAVARALEDQIMVDPNLTQQDGRFGVPGADLDAPPSRAAPKGGLLHAPAPIPAGKASQPRTLGQLAAEQASAKGPRCDGKVESAIGWANRLPAAFPLYPDAKLSEAGGYDQPDCRLRLASFTSRAPIQTLIDFYYTQALHNGFDAEHLLSGNDHLLGGTRKDGGAYYLVFTPGKDGVEIDLIANQGR